MARVVITGMGSVNALGHSAVETLEAMREGRAGIGPLDFSGSERLLVHIGAQVKNWNPKKLFDARSMSLYDPITQYAVHAANEAVAQSGLVFEGELAENSGVLLGNSGGGVNTLDGNYRSIYEEKRTRLPPLVVPRLMSNAPASHISMTNGLHGPAFSVSTACASSNHAMGQAFHMVRGGMAPVMLTGGVEAMLCLGGIKAWEGLRVLSNDTCRPFSATRSGMVQGEGAAVFIFEDYDHAHARGADILAEVIGFGMSSDASDIVTPSREGAARAVRRALSDAKISPSDVGYINAHGTGTLANDRTESAMIYDVFGDTPPPVSSTKSMHGHLIGGTSAVEMMACVMALREGVLPPTIGYEKPDPECLQDVIANTAREEKTSIAVSNAFAFGGLNAVIVLRSA